MISNAPIPFSLYKSFIESSIYLFNQYLLNVQNPLSLGLVVEI